MARQAGVTEPHVAGVATRTDEQRPSPSAPVLCQEGKSSTGILAVASPLCSEVSCMVARYLPWLSLSLIC